MRLIAFCVRHAVPVVVGVLLALLFGFIAIVGIPRQLTPTVEVPVINVGVRYLGAAPEEIEKEIVDKIEDQLQAVEGVRELTSESRENQANVRLEFDWGTSTTLAGVDVINKLSLVGDLPDEADDPVISFGEQEGHPICFIALRSEQSADELRDYAVDALRPYLKRVEGVSSVDVYGGRERQVEVTFDPYQLAAYQLTPRDLADLLARENRNTRGGRIDEDKNRFLVRTVGEFRTAEDVENVVLRRPGMPDIRLGELVSVNQNSYKDREYFVRLDGRSGIIFAVRKKTGENVVAIISQIEKAIEYLNQEVLARQNMKLEMLYNEATYVDRAIGLLQQNVFLCAALAMLVLVVFLRTWRAVLTVFVAVPISFVATFIFLWLLGRTLNVISLAGMTFAIGMLVDNAIVVLENIYRHRQMGKSAPRAALDGASEVWGAVLASTLTTVAVFVPVIFIQEEAGQLFRDIALAVAISVAISLAVSMTVIPMLSAKILRVAERLEGTGGRGSRVAGLFGIFDRFGSGFRDRVTALVAWLLESTKRRVWAVGLILVVFGAALLALVKFTPATYLPTGNRNFVLGFVITEAGSSLDHNLEVAKEIERRVRPLPNLQVFFIVALGEQMFMGARAEDADKARRLATDISAALGNKPPPGVPSRVRKMYEEYYQPPIPGIMAFAQQIGLFARRGMMGGQQVTVTIRGDDINRLYAIAGAIVPRLRAIPETLFINPSFKLGSWELRPTVDRKRAAKAGLTAADVGFAVGAIVGGVKVSDFREAGGNELDLTLRGAPEYRDHIERLEDIPLWTPRGRTVALGEVAPIRPAAGFNIIEHTEQQRSVKLDCTIQPDAPLGAVLDRIRADIIGPLMADRTIPPEYVVDLRGTARDLARMWKALRMSLLLALVITYLLMAALFESFSHPLVIILSVPLAIVGGYLMLWVIFGWNLLWGQPPPLLDVITLLGFVILIGIVVNNAILVVHQALNFIRRDGLPLHQAIVASVESRIRPIFMSTLTSITAMLPLVLRPGPGTELYQGLGSVVVGGLAVSTVFTLILTPVLFSFGFRVTQRLRRLGLRTGILVESAEEQGAGDETAGQVP